MDLNEKLAARRRELAVETEKIQQMEQDVISAEVEKRLLEKGIVSAKLPVPPISEAKIQAGVECALDQAARSRMTTGENAILAGLLFAAVASAFSGSFVGVVFCGATGVLWYSFVQKGCT